MSFVAADENFESRSTPDSRPMPPNVSGFSCKPLLGGGHELLAAEQVKQVARHEKRERHEADWREPSLPARRIEPVRIPHK
jgi:hypothetical protein